MNISDKPKKEGKEAALNGDSKEKKASQVWIYTVDEICYNYNKFINLFFNRLKLKSIRSVVYV